MFFKRKLTAVVGGVLIMVALVVPNSLAQQQNNEGGGNGLQVSPTRSEIGILPGEQKKFTIDIKNITSGELEAQASINDFQSDGFSGSPQIIVDTRERTPTTISNFIKGLKSFTLKAGESRRVELTAEVPESVAPGAYYGVVRYAAIPKGGVLNDSERQLALTASVAHMVLIEVAGDITEQIQVESLKMQKDNKSGRIFFKAPNKAALGIKNLGNGFSRPFGTASIKNMFGKQVNTYKVNDSDPKGIVLPKTSRVFTDNISGVKLPGRYTAVASVAYGNGGEVVTYKSSFWYLPAWFLITLLVLITTAVFGTRYYYRKRFTSSSSKKSRK